MTLEKRNHNKRKVVTEAVPNVASRAQNSAKRGWAQQIVENKKTKQQHMKRDVKDTL